ncbi:MAG: CDP-alcohol phosphatidyltransferase family protein [Porticoccus sp.]|jgi:phosphatidylglycerophosphate synthase|uniref:CDP-alcohol phosphatidyltransferase family protein n=1 Tax=Porticoccus sp. Uisw_050_02 TaxID=3230978 RepID=UPI0030ACDF62|tara:strand:+ start:2848 stop:3489 length:642 start_codon:yes stop_codon:yes gene_type:complete
MGLKEGRTIKDRVIKNNQAATDNFVLNFPNVVSSIRVALAPFLVYLAIEKQADIFLWILAFSLTTDCLDGYLARRLNQVTEFGVRLDSWADLITYLVMLIGLLILWPAVFHSELSYLIISVSCWIVPLLVCGSRFGCFPSYHTFAAKIASIAIAPAYFIATLLGDAVFLRGVLLFYVWVALEQVIITSILPRWQSNIAGFWVAAEIARNKNEK